LPEDIGLPHSRDGHSADDGLAEVECEEPEVVLVARALALSVRPAVTQRAEARPVVVGTVSVPSREPGMEAAVLPGSYREILAVFDTGGPLLRAAQVCELLGVETGRNQVEGMRSKLKRLVARGWLTQSGSGAYATAVSGG
jgi:hypothetical protein